ncbi:MAG: DUF2309 domain-containing protein [Chloroflexota bacterium]
MLNTTRSVELEHHPEYVLRDEVAEVCRQIPPLWDLSNYVAVNPFLGFASQPLAEAAREIDDGLDAQILPDVEYYRNRWREGAFTRQELVHVAERAGQNVDFLAAILNGEVAIPLRAANEVMTCAEDHDRHYGTEWNEKIIRHVTLWCAVQIPQDGSQWSDFVTDRGLYAAWREAAKEDRSLEIAGLRGWRAWVRDLPEAPEQAIATMLERLSIPYSERKAYLYRLLGGVFGWASYLRRGSWEVGSDEPGMLGDLLAIRICADAAVPHLTHDSVRVPVRSAMHAAVEDESLRFLFQEALEDAYFKRVSAKLAPPPAKPTRERPAVQAIFCIDVRSEPLRRHLEAQSPKIQTLGFAGFFAVSLEWQVDEKGSARCPVLLKPAVQIKTPAAPPKGAGKSTLKQMQMAPAAAFTFVETVGLAYSVGLVGDALNQFTTPRADEGHMAIELEPRDSGTGMTPEVRLNTAAGILKNMGLRETFGRLVLLCGHEGRSENNPHAAGLDCGACGGHGGAVNARVAAAVLNDPAVRAQLPAQGFQVPADTYFVPGLHDTSIDEVTLFDTDAIPESHREDVAQLQRWLAGAGAQVRAERSIALGVEKQPQGFLDKLLRRRAQDWSEVRPEWALARNAAFIAARRERTYGANLEGRSFLHEYDWKTDPDNSILTLILSAPMVVASWINLQYFASTVDNHTFGCGTKALHNRVGSLGVVLGNGGDLRTGLALQSVHAPDGSWFHEPLRLQVIVEAPQERIEAVLTANPTVLDLIDNDWVRLFALDPESNKSARWMPRQGWEHQIPVA